tara:strand:- start:74 stop:910 length:837 start_codon:yes stop_codon:yes gene_type:complete
MNPAIKVLGVPDDVNSSFMRGSSAAPPLIREALYSDSSNLFSESGLNLEQKGIWEDLGDIKFSGEVAVENFKKIKNVVKDVLASDQKLVSLGGDHSISWPVIDAHLEVWSSLDILHFDAHPDLYDNLLDNKLSHASPFARIMETGKVNRLVQIGIRTLNQHQREQAEKFGVEIYEMRDLAELNAISFSKPVYCSIDIDVLDPAYAPGVSHFEPGGLSTRELIEYINNFSGQLIGADIVEYNPRRDFHNLTAMVASKLLKEVVARIYYDNNKNKQEKNE